MKLTNNFALHEFTDSQTAKRNGIDNNPDPRHLECLRELAEKVMQPIRDALGPVIISSGYRSRALNQRIGGSQNSQHSLGQAADFGVIGMTPYEVCKWIATSDLPFDQLIYEGTWVHISYGPRHRRQVLTAHFETRGVRYTSGL